MEIKIGVTHANRELSLESTQSTADVQKAIIEALAGDSGLLSLTDDKGRTVYVPTDKLAYVEIVGDSTRRMGFASR